MQCAIIKERKRKCIKENTASNSIKKITNEL